MLWALVTTFMKSIGTIFWKRSLGIFKWQHASQYVFMIWWLFGSLLIILGYFVLGLLSAEQMRLGLYMFGIIAVWGLLVVGYTPLYQHIYQNEKLSVIMPYANLNKVFALIVSYWLYQDVSTFSLIITFVTIVVTAVFAIDWKSFTLPKMLGKFVIAEVLLTGRFLLSGYLVLELGDVLFFAVDRLVYFIIMLGIVFLSGVPGQIIHLSKKFYVNRIMASVMGSVAWLIGLFLITELWMSIVILLSFLQAWVTLLFGYLILKEKPSRKDLIMTVVVTVLVGVWFFFR